MKHSQQQIVVLTILMLMSLIACGQGYASHVDSREESSGGELPGGAVAGTTPETVITCQDGNQTQVIYRVLILPTGTTMITVSALQGSKSISVFYGAGDPSEAAQAYVAQGTDRIKYFLENNTLTMDCTASVLVKSCMAPVQTFPCTRATY